MPPGGDAAAGAYVLLGLRVLPFQSPGVRGHAADPTQRVPWRPAAVVPPRVPPCRRGGGVLPLDGSAADAVPRRGGDQRLRARGDVRVLPDGGAGAAAALEAGGDGLSDHAVPIRVSDIGSDAVPAFYWVGLLGYAGLGIQYPVRDVAVGALY